MTKEYYKHTCRLLIVTAICLSYHSAFSQHFKWVKSYGGANKDKGKELGVDVAGNLYLSGFFTDEITLGTITLDASGPGSEDEDIFISKFDADGIPLWAHSMGNGFKNQGDYPFGMSVNGNGFMAATGQCFKYVKIDNGDSIPAFGLEDMWLMTYDPDGNFNWAKVGGGVGTDVGTAVYIDDAQNIYCAGNLEGSVDFYGDSMLTAGNDPQIFVAKYAWGGDLVWIKTFTSGHSVNAHDLKLDGDGNIYVGGNFRNTITFGTTVLTSYGDGDGFVLKLNPSGDVLWATSFGSNTGSSEETAATLSLDENGNCYVATIFSYDCNYDGGTLTTNDKKNIMIAAYDPLGNFIWAEPIRGGPDAKFSPITLAMWVEDNVLITGIFTGIDTIGTQVLEPYNDPDSADAFLASVSLAGNVNWALHVGGPSHDGGFGVAGNNSLYGFATGNFRNTAEFDSTINLVSNGLSDIWIAKFEKNTGVGNTTISTTNQDFQTFPNPFNNQIVVRIPRYTSQLIIYNILGQVVLQRNIDPTEKQVSLDFYAPPAGMYNVQLSGDYGVVTGKIEKQSY